MGTIADKDEGVKRLDLFDALSCTWLRLPFAAMRECGAAAQTFGGLLCLTKRQTFASVEKISVRAHLPVPTVRKHLTDLQRAGFIRNDGRGRTKTGFPRRTNTIALTERGAQSAQDFAALPWFLCCRPRPNAERPRWRTRAVGAVVFARLMKLKGAVEKQFPHAFQDQDHWEVIENFADAGRWEFSVSDLEDAAGLSRHSVIEAKRDLKGLGFVNWIASNEPFGKHLLQPNPLFYFAVKDTLGRPGWVTLIEYGAQKRGGAKVVRG
jgi:Mn-dependent DtxR family transcriptional regulator